MSGNQEWKTLQNFVLAIEQAGGEPGTYRVEASRTPGGEAEALFKLPVDDRDVEILLLKLERPRTSATKRGGKVPEPAQESIDFGHKLYQAVMTGDVRDLYLAARNDAERGGYGLRLQLRLNDAPELADLPWEFLHDGRGFVALSHDTPLVRYLDLPNVPRAMAINLPLRILVMISAPIDQVPLDVDVEQKRIDSALAPLRQRGVVEVEYITDGKLGSLHRALTDAKADGRPFHAWHYIGHGAFDPVDQQSVLVFCDDDGRSSLVVGFQLGTLMSNFPSLRVAVLNACEGARANRQDPFAGVAAALVESGVSAVIGMQFPISDKAAIVLSGAFYDSLVAGLPVDVAITEARMNVFLMPNWAEWATPILFMRAPDGKIFDIGAAATLPARRAAAPGGLAAWVGTSTQRVVVGGLVALLVGAAGVYFLLTSAPGGQPEPTETQASTQAADALAGPTLMATPEIVAISTEVAPDLSFDAAPAAEVTDVPSKISELAALFNNDSTQLFDVWDIEARADFFSMDDDTRTSLFADEGGPVTPQEAAELVSVARGVSVALDADSYGLLPGMISRLEFFHTSDSIALAHELKLMKEAREAQDAGDDLTAVEKLEAVVALNPQNSTAIYQLAMMKFEAHDIPGALEALDALSRIAQEDMSPAPSDKPIPERAFVTRDQVSGIVGAALCSNAGLGSLDTTYQDLPLPYLRQVASSRGSGGAATLQFESWPTVDHRILQHFMEHPEWYTTGGLKGSEGIDFKAQEGAEVYAVAAGVVSEVRLDGDKFRELPTSDATRWSYAYGNQIRLVFSVGCGEYTAIYAHLSQILVNAGDVVQPGDLIGYAGNTGNSTGTHLRFVLKLLGATDRGETPQPRDFIDPEPFLAELGP